MKISMHTVAVESFIPMLTSLSGVLEKGAAYAKGKKVDLMSARLAPDMYTLSQQVQLACDHAREGVSRLTGIEAPRFENNEKTIGDLATRIEKTVNYLQSASASAFEGAEDRDCSIQIPNDLVIVMHGTQFLCAWALPQLYFHVVTAYDILRHHGVTVGKQDYLSQ